MQWLLLDVTSMTILREFANIRTVLESDNFCRLESNIAKTTLLKIFPSNHTRENISLFLWQNRLNNYISSTLIAISLMMLIK
jgi:hypothetical protein